MATATQVVTETTSSNRVEVLCMQQAPSFTAWSNRDQRLLPTTIAIIHYIFNKSKSRRCRMIQGLRAHKTLLLCIRIKLHFSGFDWCCFCYFVRNSLVALLEALCARIFPLDSWMSVFFWHFFCFFCACVCARSLTKPFFRLSQPGSCAWLSPFLWCADCTFVLVCVCLCMCMWKCVGKVINI